MVHLGELGKRMDKRMMQQRIYSRLATKTTNSSSSSNNNDYTTVEESV